MPSAVANFLEWWRDELSTFIPTRARGLVGRYYNEIGAEISDGQVLLFRNDGQGFREVVTISSTTSSPERGRRIVQQAIGEQSKRKLQIILALPADRVVSRRLTFPAAAEENLRQIASYEMARRTPFHPDEVYFDIEIMDRAPESGSITVTLYVVHREAVNEAVAIMTALGLRPNRVGISTAPGKSVPNINFLSPQSSGTRNRLEKSAAAALGVLTVALLTAAIVLPLERKRDLSARLTEQVATMRSQVALVTRLEQEIDEARQRNHFIANERQLSPPAVAVMDDLTRLLPDDTWLFQMHLKDGHVSMQGYTNAVSALVELIESSPRFQDVAVQSNITRDQKTGQERFHITFDIAAGGG